MVQAEQWLALWRVTAHVERTMCVVRGSKDDTVEVGFGYYCSCCPFSTVLVCSVHRTSRDRSSSPKTHPHITRPVPPPHTTRLSSQNTTSSQLPYIMLIAVINVVLILCSSCGSLPAH
ncbi:hypothetical protein K439DRAFT_140617 [Ramaria rubella]|nr:hypothetical protein K439DRAFT_140617 [Ramaria rubella]